MSFGGFSFGSTPAPSAPTSTNVPSFSLTPAQAPAAQPAASPFSFGGASSSSAPTQPQAGGGAAPSPFSFGSTAAQPAAASTPAPAGGLFGSAPAPAATTGTTGTGTGLFGGGGGAGLFGASPAAPATAPGAPAQGSNTFSFGQTPQQPAQQTSLFGSTPAAGAPGSGASTGLFGQSTAAKPATGLFGQSTSTPAPSGGLFGQSTSQPAQTSLFGSQTGTAGQPQGGSNLGSSTSGASGQVGKTSKFTDLPEPVQKTIEQMDEWIKQQKEAGKGTNTTLLGQVIWQTSGDVKAANEEYTALSQGLVAIQANLEQLRAKFVTEEEDLRKVAEIWETFKSANGRPGSVRVAGHGEFPQDFFGRAARAMAERVQRYQKTIAQLQRHLAALLKENDVPTASAIGQTIQNHQNAILNLAGTLERLQVKMNLIRTLYAEAYRERTNSMRDPFDVAREEKGLPPVRS